MIKFKILLHVINILVYFIIIENVSTLKLNSKFMNREGNVLDLIENRPKFKDKIVFFEKKEIENMGATFGTKAKFRVCCLKKIV